MPPTRILLLILLVYCVTVTSARAAIDCEAVKPNTGTDRSIEDNFKGQANILFKSLGSGEIENGYRKVESDVLSKYPHADQLLLWRSYLYVTCTLLASSTQWTDDQKFQKLKELITLSIGPPPTQAPQPSTSQATPPSKPPIVAMTNHGTNVRPGLSGREVAQILDPTSEGARLYAIQQMVKQDSIRSPLSADEVALILKGTTGSTRAQGVADLAKLIKSNLSGQEGATILGNTAELSEGSRQFAVQALATATRLGATGSDTSLILKGMTGSARAQSIADIASSLKPNLSGQEASVILGASGELNEGSRLFAIQALVHAGKLRSNLPSDELTAILEGMTGSARAQGISELTKN